MSELKGIADVGAGIPNDCSLSISLILQLMPYLSGLTCFLRVLKVIKVLGDFAGAVPNIPKMGETAPKLASSIEELFQCFGLLDPTAILRLIKQIILLIIKLLNCVLGQIRSLLTLQLSIDLDGAADNPALQSALKCAQDNAQNQMESLTNALEGLAPVFDILGMLGSIAGQSFTFPALGGQAGQDVAQTLDTIQGVMDTLQMVADTLPD
jgi:hypothetical protein